MRPCAGAKIISDIRVNPRLSVAGLVCLCLAGLVGVFGFGVAFDGGHVATFAADFAVGGFAGPGAGAIFAGNVRAHAGLGPVFGFFHEVRMACVRAGSMGVFALWRARPGADILPPMKFPEQQRDVAVANGRAPRPQLSREPLFGDPRWIEERLRALRARIMPPEKRPAT